MSEPLLAALSAVILGWGGFSWRRAEQAVEISMRTSDAVDKLEVKLAEQYLTKEEFRLQMDRMFDTLSRLETKLDYVAYDREVSRKQFFEDRNA